MSFNVPIQGGKDLTAPTPQNTPLNQAPIALGLSRPTVPDIKEDDEGQPGQQDGAGEDEDIEEIQTGGSQSIQEQQLMMGLVQGRLAGLVGASSGYVESLPVEIKLNVEGLKGVQVKYNELQNAYKRECLELEKKYLELAQPLFARRSEIISGSAPATEAEIEAGEEAEKKEDEEYAPLSKDAPPSSQGVPEFWLTALRTHPALSDFITDRDVDALKFISDIRLEYLKEGDTTDPETGGKPGFKIIFEFTDGNPFFDNKILEKKYVYQPEVGYTGDFVYDRAIGTKISWKEDKDLTKEFEIKKQRNKNTNRTRLVRKAKPADSFFNFFSPPVPPTEEQLETGELDDEEIAELEEKLEIDYQIGEDLKEKIIPRAIDYFTGKALEYELDDEDDFGEDEDEDDEPEGGSDEESGSDNDVPVRRRVKGGKRGGAPGPVGPAAGANNEECKQQ